MSRDALWFERLVVRRMPGLEDGGFPLDDLSPGVNVVHGPNASGKTTAARAIEALLWPRAAAPERASLAARFRLGDATWSAELDAGRVRYQRDGADAPAPALPPAETRDRYRLSLHELLGTENRELAAEIVRESAGGYDLARAAASLDVRDAASRRTNELKALKAAREKLREARSGQEALRAEEAELDSLRRRADRAADAARRARLLRHAVEHAEAVEAAAAARRALAEFPAPMARLHGDEADRLDALRRKLDDARERVARAERDHAAADAARRDAALPDDGVPHQTISALRGRIEKLGELRREVEARERALADAVARRDAEAREIGWIGSAAAPAAAAGRADGAGAPDDPHGTGRLPAIDAAALEALAAFARDAGEVEGRRVAAEAEVRWLAEDGGPGGAAGGLAARSGTRAGTTGAGTEPGAGDPAAHADALADGAALLRRWLRAAGAAPGVERRLRTLGALAAALLLAVSGAAAWVALGIPPAAPAPGRSGLALAPALAAAAALVLLLLILRRADGPDPGAVHRAEFERLGLERAGVAPPARWTPDDVAACLDRLERRLSAALLARERERRRAEALRRRAALEPELDALEARRAALAERLGIAPEGDPAKLFWLVQRIARWQDAARAADGAAAALEAARSQFADALADARERIARFGYGALDDVAALAAAVDDLDRRREAHRKAAADAAQALRRREDAAADAAGHEEERRAVLERIGLGPDDDAIVRAWCARLDAYREARDRCADAERRREDARRRLEETPGYAPGLDELGADALRDALDAAEAEAAEADALRDRITAITTRIEEAKKSHDVEAALAEVARCEDALRDGRERDTLAVVAGALVRFVQRSTRDQHRPEVFHRARELFTRITHGRYRLDFDDGDPPAFRAFDTTTGTGHALDELSSGTRVQLLLAVRIAFVESRETGARLPLIFDETLGNSDDARALAIMQSALALAADGRQVFYFTAQPDEVGKWQGVLEAHPDVPSRVVDLARVRRLARGAATPLPVVDPPAAAVPAPGDASHAEYGRILGVPPIGTDGVPGGVHLWYLVDDPETLYRLLSLRVETWGALRALVEHGGLALLGDDAHAFERARAAARALEAAAAALRIGRGRPVDRAAIVESGAVSETFLDRVDALCQACGGDAAMLIEAIEAGRLPRFRSSALDALRDHLERHGYLDPRDPLDAAQVRARVLAAVAEELHRGTIDVHQVDRAIAACGGPGGEARGGTSTATFGVGDEVPGGATLAADGSA
ncbi:MAG TPA: AAA family ATPase [Longimicrobiales bacterium]